MKHFEALFYVGLWVDAAVLAAIVGRPWLGLIGVVTVLPFVVAYVRSSAARADR